MSQPYQVLARKYRPQHFGELLGQEAVRTTLENAIGKRRIAHGYIFAGQRGTGKTTVARILARCLNCEQGPTPKPCGVCASCQEVARGGSMDVIEIDAASNRGINEMRELRENVRFRPARDRYKVFIIDEAHQITTEAFNALLKTLEEPPEWVVFILCTTETHKIPATIASRCQQFSFRSVDFTLLVDRMREICAAEGVTADEEALAVIAQSGEGSVRDSLSALDQAIAACGSQLEGDAIRELLGRFSLNALGQVTDSLETSDTRRLLELVSELERNGQSLQHFCRELARYFRNLLVAKTAGPGSRLIAASSEEQQRLAQVAGRFTEPELTRYLHLTLEMFKDLQTSTQPRLHLELGLVKLGHASRLKAIEEILSGAVPAIAAAPVAAAAAPRPTAPAPVAAPSPAAEPASGDLRDRLIAELQAMKATFTVDAIERSTVEQLPSELIVTAPAAYKLALQGPELGQAAHKVLGRPMKITIRAGEAAAAPAQKKTLNAANPQIDPEAERRALAHPDVQRFQELFPGSEIRAVRDLSDYGGES